MNLHRDYQSLKAFRYLFELIEKHEGVDTDPVAGAEHDVIFWNLSTEDVPPDSPEGKQLEEYGFFPDDDGGGYQSFA